MCQYNYQKFFNNFAIFFTFMRYGWFIFVCCDNFY